MPYAAPTPHAAGPVCACMTSACVPVSLCACVRVSLCACVRVSLCACVREWQYARAWRGRRATS
eukprot:4228922-Pleurochrysis_carterae.AAC.1